MDASTIRTVKEGLAAGLVAGVLFVIAEILAAASAGDPALTPFPMFASVVVGADAFEQLSLPVAVLIGTIVHFALSAIFGIVYGFFASREAVDARRSWKRHALLGAAYGCALWLINYQLIGRLAYPWFADTNAVAQLIVHAFFYGLPLGLLFVATERSAGGERATREAPAV